MIKEAKTNVDIHDYIRQRWSPYGFSSKLVPREDVRAILEAARWAASSYNEQPWRFVLATRDDEAAFAKVLGCLVEANQAWAKHVPVLLLTFIKKTFTKNGKPNRVAEHDLGLAAATLTFEATRRGLHVHQMAGIDTEKAQHEFKAPDDFAAMTAIAVGYAVEDTSQLSDSARKVDEAPRERRPLGQTVFADTWGKPAEILKNGSD